MEWWTRSELVNGLGLIYLIKTYSGMVGIEVLINKIKESIRALASPDANAISMSILA